MSSSQPTNRSSRALIVVTLVFTGIGVGPASEAWAEDSGIAAQISEVAPAPRAAPGWGGEPITAVMHENGRRAWSGLPGAPVRHANGRPAWAGVAGEPVFHANGRRAWSGVPGEPCYSEHGAMLATSCEAAVIDLGEGITLSVDERKGTVVDESEVMIAGR